jgi:hypothetical protein
MGHLIFIVLHLVALFFGAILLFLTIPAHLIFAAIRSKKRDPNTPRPDTHVRCPDCKEFVLKDATVCKHCGCKLIPQH